MHTVASQAAIVCTSRTGVTQPGYFCAVGDGITVGRDDASPITSDYTAPFRFTGGSIDKVVDDVSGDRYIDHEAQVRAWFRHGLDTN